MAEYCCVLHVSVCFSQPSWIGGAPHAPETASSKTGRGAPFQEGTIMKPRNLSIILAAGLALTAAGCGSSNDSADPSKSAAPSANPNAPVSISINCEPPKTNKVQRATFEEDVAAFQKLYPNITVSKVTDAFPCYEPKTFEPKLASGDLETVFYVNFPNVGRLIESGQAAD